MSAPRIRMSRSMLGLDQFSSSALPKHAAERSQQPTSSPTIKRKPAAEYRRLQSARVTAGAWPAKYLMIAMLGVLMAALLACGANAEPEGGQSSDSAAPTPTAIPTDAPAVAQVAAVATPTDTPVPAVVSEPPRTLTTTDASPQTMPTDTPALTHAAATPAPEPTPVPKRGGTLRLVLVSWPENWDTEAGKKAVLGESGAWQVIHEEWDGTRGSIKVAPSPGYESDRGGPYLDGIEIHVSVHGVRAAGITSSDYQGYFGPMKDDDFPGYDLLPAIIGSAVGSPHFRIHTWGDRVSDEELELEVATGNWYVLDEVPMTLIDCRVRGYQSTDLPQSLDDWVHVWLDYESSCEEPRAGVLYTPSGKASRIPQLVSAQPVAILTPGVALGKEVWWYRPGPSGSGDQTPPGVLENHPHGRQLTRLHSADVWTLMLDQVTAVLREANPVPADQEAQAIGGMTHLDWGWEIADADEPLVMYWRRVFWGDKWYRAGAVVRYDSNGEPEGFVEAPGPAIGFTEGLQSKWWEKDIHVPGDLSRIIVYEGDDPDLHGPALDLLDGKLDHYDYENANENLQAAIREAYTLRIAGAIHREFVTAAEPFEGFDKARSRGPLVVEIMKRNMNWEVINTQDLTVRFWGRIDQPAMKRRYKVGAILQFTISESPPIGPHQAKRDELPPVKNFLHYHPTVLEFFITPIDK